MLTDGPREDNSVVLIGLPALLEPQLQRPLHQLHILSVPHCRPLYIVKQVNNFNLYMTRRNS